MQREVRNPSGRGIHDALLSRTVRKAHGKGYAVLGGGLGGVPDRRTSKGRRGKWDSDGDWGAARRLEWRRWGERRGWG